MTPSGWLEADAVDRSARVYRVVTARVLSLSQKAGRTDRAGFAELSATIRLAEARNPEP